MDNEYTRQISVLASAVADYELQLSCLSNQTGGTGIGDQ